LQKTRRVGGNLTDSGAITSNKERRTIFPNIFLARRLLVGPVVGLGGSRRLQRLSSGSCRGHFQLNLGSGGGFSATFSI
jgi:hypothetical protein